MAPSVYGIHQTRSKLSFFISCSFIPNSSPSQVIYSTGMILSAAWMPSFSILSVGNADGTIALYQLSASQPSVSYEMNSFQSCYEETDGSCNGLFDNSHKEP